MSDTTPGEDYNSFPKLGIDTKELIDFIEDLIASAAKSKEDMGAVNWGDIGVTDIEYRISMLYLEDGPTCCVIVEEAARGCGLENWLNCRLANDPRFPNVHVLCEW